MDDIDFNFQDSASQKEDEKLIEDRSKLELGYIPDRIKHRSEQINDLAQYTLSDVANGKKGSDSIVIGPPGTGKTATVKFLREQTEKQNDQSKFNIEYINCSTHSSSQAVFRELCNRVGTEYKQGVEISKNINKFKEELERQDYESILIVLDEIQELRTDRRDYLSKPVLYQLSRPDEAESEKSWGSSITVIGISNDEDILSYLDSDVKSSMEGPKIVQFPRYTEGEIVNILHDRQSKAYVEPVLSSSALKKIAKEVSDNFDGDIRKGMEILKKVPKSSGDVMILKDNEQEQIDVVDRIITEIQKDRIRSAMYSEEDDFYIVMSSLYQQIIENKPRLNYISESYNKACEAAMREKKGNNPDARKSYVYRQLQKLVDEDLLEKTKSHKEMNKPNRYEANFNPELFREIVEDMLKRKQLFERLKSKDYSVSNIKKSKKSEIEKEAEEESEEILDAHTSAQVD